MFYSHEVLTSREHGVATVWLVATLGSRSGLKKVGRKDILQVNVRKACATIVDPGAPMALRLQGSLLYGVSRVYAEQCSYVFHDVQSAHNQMKHMLQIAQVSRLDVDKNKSSRPELLLLQDDPAYVPTLDWDNLPSDLLDPGLTTDDGSVSAGIASPRTPRSRGSGSGRGLELDIIIPSSPSGGLGGFVGDGFSIPSASGSRHGRAADLNDGQLNHSKDTSTANDLGDFELFEFDEAGNIIEPAGAQQTQDTAHSPALLAPPAVDSTVEDAPQDAHVDPMNLDLPPDNDDDAVQPQDRATTTSPTHPSSSSHEPDTSSMTMPQRRARSRKILADTQNQLRNSTIKSWSEDYAANMAHASTLKTTQRTRTLAPQNARFWLWDTGLGGIGAHLRHLKDHPLHRFAGDQLRTHLLGEPAPPSRKRTRSTSEPGPDGSDASGRRVRSASGSPELARGDDEDRDLAAAALGYDEDIEQGRHAATPLHQPDQDALMPWNRSSSAVQGVGSRRTVSASPLHGKGAGLVSRSRHGSVSASSQAFGGLPDLPLSAGLGDDDAYLGRPDSQNLAESQGMRAALDRESGNFLDFVKTTLEQEGDDTVTFELLLPPRECSRVVAAQGFLHVLTLATKRMLAVDQAGTEGDIVLSMQAE